MYLCLKERMLLYNWILVLLSLQSFEANPRKNIIESIECRLNICTKEIFKIHQYIDALNSSNADVERVKRDVVLSKLIDVDNENDLCYTRGEIFRRNGLREEKKWARNQINNIQSDVTAQAINMDHLQNELTAVKSRTEALSAEIDVKLVRFNDTIFDVSDLQTQQMSQCQAQINNTDQRLYELNQQQLIAARKFQSIIDEKIASNDKELKTIVEKVGSIETEISLSLTSNIKNLENELTTVKSRTEAVTADIDIKLERLNNTVSNISDLQKQHNSHCQYQIDITDEKINELQVQQRNASREFQLIIDEAIANKDKELKTIVGKVESIDTQLSQSLSSNMKHIENELTVVKSRTEEIVDVTDSALLEFNGTLSDISEIQKQQNSHCQAFFNNTGERLDELNVQQLTVSRELQSSIDQAIARKDKQLKTITDKVGSLETQLLQLHESNIRNLENELTAVRSRTEAVAVDIDIKLERLNDTVSTMSDIQKKHSSHYQAQIDINGKRIYELNVQQLKASREFQLTIDEAIANKDRELKTIVEQVGSIETQLSQSLQNNMNHLQNELTSARSETKALAAEIEVEILRFNGSISNMSDIQKQQNSHYLAQINNTDERLHKLNIHVLTDALEIRSTIDLAKAGSEKELKQIQENVRRVETQLSKSLGSNMEDVQKELTAVRSRTEAVAAELEKKAREIRSIIDVAKASNEKELKVMNENLRRVETQLSESHASTTNLKNDWTGVKARIESVTTATDINIERFNNTMSGLSGNLKQLNSNYQAQAERLNKLSVEQLATSVKLQSAINEVIVSKDKELNLIRDYVKNMEKWFLSLHSHCPSGWKNFMGYCYYLHQTSTSFNEARKSCELNDSVLVDVQSSAENDFIGSYGQWLWLGISDVKLNGNWTIVGTGNPILFSNWDAGQPQGKEDCAVLYTTTNFPWHDYMCTSSSRFRFICRKPAH